LSDVHLDHFYDTEFLNSLVRKVNALNPEAIFITGDLFDGMAKTISHFAAGLDQLRATKGIFFVTGNHETYVGLHRALNVLKKTKIQVIPSQDCLRFSQWNKGQKLKMESSADAVALYHVIYKHEGFEQTPKTEASEATRYPTSLSASSGRADFGSALLNSIVQQGRKMTDGQEI
jgi:predicted MPP superfamily phosphohydrolase